MEKITSQDSPDIGILESLIIEEHDIGLFDQYLNNTSVNGDCKRISHCSCDCDRCDNPWIIITG